MDTLDYGDEQAARLITTEVLIESIPHIGKVAAGAVANRIIDSLAEVEII